MTKIDGKYKQPWTEDLLKEIEAENSITKRHHLINKYLHQRDIQIEKIISNIENDDIDLEEEIEEHTIGMPMSEFTHESEAEDFHEWAREEFKYFFELGVRVNNPITAADRGTAEEIIINLKRVEQDYRINLTKEMKWLRNKVKKGE